MPDMLDDLTVEESKTDPKAAQDWEAMKIVTRLQQVRKEKGLTQGDVAARMGLPQQRIAELERRPWGAGFGRVVAYARAIGVEVGIVGELVEAA